MPYILIVFYATTAGLDIERAFQGVRRSHAVVMQEFNSDVACKNAANTVMQAGASAHCLPKGTVK